MVEEITFGSDFFGYRPDYVTIIPLGGDEYDAIGKWNNNQASIRYNFNSSGGYCEQFIELAHRLVGDVRIEEQL